MYQALYRSFRPETFDGVLGQEHIVKILKNQIRTGTTGHAYLFCGTRGTGKTSSARLLAKGVNCLAEEGDRPCGVCENCKSIKEGTFMDVIEIDAASNNGVENIRELRESVKYPPVMGRCKVYIIDEVHMLSTGAFNALLKTLEEPPENVMFILATTEVQKLPATILSRCLRLDFHRIPENQLRKGMRDICAKIGVEISDSALGLIAVNADGSARDGLSLLDQCISGGEKIVSREDVLALLGTSGEEVFIEITDYIHTQQVAEALLLLNRVLSDGKDVRQFIKDWIAHFRSLLMTKFIKNPEDLLNMSTENVERIRTQSERMDLHTINDSILELSRTLADAKWSTQPRILLELAIVRMGSGVSSAPGGGGARRPAAPVRSGLAASSEPMRRSGTCSQSGTGMNTADAKGNGLNTTGANGIGPNTTRASGTGLGTTGASEIGFSTAVGAGAGDGPAGHTGDTGLTGSAGNNSGAGDAGAVGNNSGAGDAGAFGSGVVGSGAGNGEAETAAAVSEMPDFDLDELWHLVFEDGEALRGSFNLLRRGTVLAQLDGESFTVEVSNDMMEKFAKDNKSELEQFMEKRTGRRLRMIVRLLKEDNAQEIDKAKEVVQSMEARLGINIEIQ